MFNALQKSDLMPTRFTATFRLSLSGKDEFITVCTWYCIQTLLATIDLSM